MNGSAVLVIVDHMKTLASNWKERLCELRQFDSPTRMRQPVLEILSGASVQYQDELTEMQNDKSVKTLSNIKGAMAWLCVETDIDRPRHSKLYKKTVLTIPIIIFI